MSPVSTRSRGMDCLLDAPVYGHLAHRVTGLGGGGYLSELEPVRTAGHLTLIQIGAWASSLSQQLYRGPFEKENRA